MSNKLLNAMGWLALSIGEITIIILRIVGIDLTEGQLLIKYWPFWIFAFCMCISGVGLIQKK